MKKDPTILNRGEKILLFLYKLGKGKKKRFVYEDIVVGLFKKYPNDFHLKGYPEYPDSSDSSQRLLYEFKKKGYVSAANKIFSLTDSGVDFAKVLSNRESSIVGETFLGRPSRATTMETERIKNLEGFSLFLEGKENQLSESDFYNYLGVTAKTSPSTFSGRMRNIETSINEMRENKNDPLSDMIIMLSLTMAMSWVKLTQILFALLIMLQIVHIISLRHLLIRRWKILHIK